MLAERWVSAEESKWAELTLLRALTRVPQSKLLKQIERRRIETQAIEFEAWRISFQCSSGARHFRDFR
jgi:hypothetical protein